MTTIKLKELYTNIKGLPEGRTYFTEYGYSQSYPWVMVKRTAKTATLAKVNVVRDPEWMPVMHPGGFCMHCSNQSEQTWLFSCINEGHTKVVRLNKKGQWVNSRVQFDEDKAVEFYDYNF